MKCLVLKRFIKSLEVNISMPEIKRALISVANKDKIVDFAQELVNLNIKLLASGGTAKLLTTNKIKVTDINEIEGISNLLSGRIKTLHPKILAGILCDRNNPKHVNELDELGISTIDLIVVNFYPFAENVAKTNNTQEQIEFIDIGGPTMVRSAAKNHAHVSVVINPDDYTSLTEELINNKNKISIATNKKLAGKVFDYTSNYDATIANYLNDDNSSYNTVKGNQEKLRYGENPHQQAAVYNLEKLFSNLGEVQLSYNNINDAILAFNCVTEHELPTCANIKHATPCGVASANDLATAIELAFASDPKSAYGGVVAVNQELTHEELNKVSKKFLEVIIAPSYANDCQEIFKIKKNTRFLAVNKNLHTSQEIKSINNVTLVQDADCYQIKESDLQIVSNVKASDEDIADMLFAWKVAKYAHSNAIVIAKNMQSIGIGNGQTSRVGAVELAIKYAKEHNHVLKDAVVASDGFFPFADGVEILAKEKIKAIIQPGGSKRDEEVINAVNQTGIIMAFTNIRHFRH